LYPTQRSTALRRPDQRVNIGDLFGAFKRFWTMLVLMIITVPAVLLGLVFLIVPGLLLMTIWLYAFLLVVDRGMGVFDSLNASQTYTCLRFGTHFLISTVTFGLVAGASFIPYVGWAVSCLISPLCWLVVVIAYRRQTQFE